MSFATLVLSVLPVVAQADKPKDEDLQKRQTKIESTIELGIELLEKKEYEKLIKTLAHPDDVKKITESKSLAEIAAAFGERKAAEVLEAFKTVKGSEPKYEDDKTRAEFSKEDFPKLRRSLRFQKSGNSWYIRN